MKKLITLSLITFYLTNPIRSQDTLFSNLYPKGIVINSYQVKKSTYTFHPVDNPTMEISVNKNDIYRISSTKEVNPNIKAENLFIVPVE